MAAQLAFPRLPVPKSIADPIIHVWVDAGIVGKIICWAHKTTNIVKTSTGRKSDSVWDMIQYKKKTRSATTRMLEEPTREKTQNLQKHDFTSNSQYSVFSTEY